MKRSLFFHLAAVRLSLLLGTLVLVCFALPAQDSVTVPKSRLEELERKERELDRLQGDLNQTQGQLKQAQTNLTKVEAQNVQLKKEVAEAPKPAPAVPVYIAPPLTSLPPLGGAEVVDSLDLAGHYKADAAAADARYRKKKFTVRGEIIGFEKPMFQARYQIMLKTAEPDIKVICEVYPPEKYKAVIIVRHGDQIDGMIEETHFPLAKVRDTIEIKGECRGLKDGVVRMGGCVLGASR
jgi:hypothetical protein